MHEFLRNTDSKLSFYKKRTIAVSKKKTIAIAKLGELKEEARDIRDDIMYAFIA